MKKNIFLHFHKEGNSVVIPPKYSARFIGFFFNAYIFQHTYGFFAVVLTTLLADERECYL